MDDQHFMNMALELALQGQGYTSPNPMVGAVVVKDGKVVGRGYHQAAGQPHAEVKALREAAEAARGATLVVTLEPCNHYGKTPPCTHQIVACGIRRVVAAMLDPNPDVAGGGTEYLRQQGITVTLGVCEHKARRLNEAFIKYIRTKRPFVILKCAATLDGRIATRSGDSRWVSGGASRNFVHRLRHAVDAIMVGIGTIKNDDPSLTCRLETSQSKDPIRIILDTHLSIPLDARVLRLQSDSDTILVASSAADATKKAALAEIGVQLIEAPLKQNVIDLSSLMDTLGTMNVTSLLVEGGSRVSGTFIRSGLADKLLFFFAPKILGGDDGVPILRGRGAETMDQAIRVEDLQMQRIGEDVLIEGYLKK